MKKTFLVVSIFWVSVLLCSNPLLASEPKIAWFRSNSETGFWPMVERFVVAASKDLGVDLNTYTHGENPMAIVSNVKKVLANSDTRPDAILFHNFKSRGKEILELSQRYDVPAFVFNSGFKESDDVGRPREKYKNWIGMMLPDDEYAGFILAKKLMREAKKINKLGKDGKIHVVALEGNRVSEASNERVRGLKKAVENSEFHVEQYFHSKWREPLAAEAFELSIVRYPKVSVFWAASDSMAIGVINAAKKHGWIPGRDFVTGGVDLLPRNQAYLESGKLSVSVGGHYAEGAWAIIALYDYLKGYDFAQTDSVVFATKMGSYTSSELTALGDLREKLSQDNIDRIDFKRFSRAYHPDLEKYHFEFNALFK
ncbi:MAG: ABC transporter substrate-binding protein [Desulfobacter sp.]|nr:MAG: ABC transporter substrate-binding protein [Desulfobacter sp.]